MSGKRAIKNSERNTPVRRSVRVRKAGEAAADLREQTRDSGAAESETTGQAPETYVYAFLAGLLPGDVFLDEDEVRQVMSIRPSNSGQGAALYTYRLVAGGPVSREVWVGSRYAVRLLSGPTYAARIASAAAAHG